MALVVQVKDSGGLPIKGLFRKVNTEADVSRFVGAESGHAQIINVNDNTVLSDGRNRVTVGPLWPSPNSTPQYVDFVLDFRYFVGLNQLGVASINPTLGYLDPIVCREIIDRARQSWTGWPSSFLDPTGQQVGSFEEISPDTVRVRNPRTVQAFFFAVPHTSLQAISRARVVVANQGDNIGMEFLGNNDGILLRSRSGRKGLLRIDDQYSLVITRK